LVYYCGSSGPAGLGKYVVEKLKIKNQILKIRKFLNFDFCILIFERGSL